MNQGHLIATIIFSFILGANAFSYKDAKNWGKKYPECKGHHQSPILINQNVKNGFDVAKPALKLADFDELPKKLTIKNTGHAVEIKADWPGKPPRLTGGPLDGNYVFEKTTLHWAQEEWAEEVTPEGQKDKYLYDMDIHMFFYKTDFKSFKKAETQKGGLAVFKMGLWIVKDEDQYLFGDHDYPPCSESVTWFIGNANGPIPKGLVNEVRKIKLAEGDVSNVRSVQPLNKREIRLVYFDSIFVKSNR